jgi:hypothetical protein
MCRNQATFEYNRLWHADTEVSRGLLPKSFDLSELSVYYNIRLIVRYHKMLVPWRIYGERERFSDAHGVLEQPKAGGPDNQEKQQR